MYLQTRGFILKQRNWREADKLVTLYTEKGGKLNIRARGVRKIQSKLGGQLREFALIDFNLARGKNSYQLIGASLDLRFKIYDLRTLTYGFYFLELVDKLTREEQRNDEVYDLLKEGLKELAGVKGIEELKKLRVAFLLKLLKATGFNPEKRVVRLPVIQASLKEYLNRPLAEIVKLETNGELKTLFNISQYTLNEIIEEPLKTVKFLQAL